MNDAKHIQEEDISFDEISDHWVTLKLGSEKFVMDLDTLIDLAFRSSAFLSHLEGRQESGDGSLCCIHKNSLH